MTTGQADRFLSAVAASSVSRQFVSHRLLEVDYIQAQALLTRHAREHRLRTLDALHLASAMRRRDHSGIDWFVSADQALAAVATLEDFKTLIPA